MTEKFIKKIEALVNRGLAMDPEVYAELDELEGRVVSLELTGNELTLYIFPSAGGIRIESEYDGDADVCVRGSLINLFVYFLTSGGKAEGITGRLEITGDVGLAQQFQAILKGMDLDLEEYISRWTGDTIARKLGIMVKDSRKIAVNSRDTIAQDISEYLRYERELLPDQTDIDRFIQETDRLRDDVERLKLRLERLADNLQERV